MDTREQLKLVQGSMLFLASVANGLEEVVGRGAPSVTFRTGRTLGLRVNPVHQETDIFKAFDLVGEELKRMGIAWGFEPYKKKSEAEYLERIDGEARVKIVYRDCMVRSCQFHYGHPQKNSLCMMQHGIFCGLFQKVQGSWAGYDPIHSGENACIGVLKIKQ